MDQFSRTALLLGRDGVNRLHKARVAIFGIGGVGGFTAEALARAGVGQLELFDNDTVSLTNINRQIIALHSTVGRVKVDVMEEHLKDINPDIVIVKHRLFYTPETAETVDLSGCDYIVDAIDTVSAKLELAVRAKALGIPLITALGAGNKLDPTRLQVSDISKTSVCPLAKVMRVQLKKRGINHLKVVWSDEPPLSPADENEAAECHAENPNRRAAPGSVSFVPSVMGLIIAGEVIKDLVRTKDTTDKGE